jgi:hypothetical protein
MSYIGKIPANAVLTTADLADGIVTAAKIEDGTVVAAEIASNAVTTAKINADAITAAKIADNAVVTAGINADAVTSAKIADDAISEEHLDVTAITGHTAETSVADGDLVVIHDASATALRKMTVANLVANAGSDPFRTLISTSTITSNASTLTITGMDSTYSRYFVTITDLHSTNDNVHLDVQLVIGGAVKTGTNYEYGNYGRNSNDGASGVGATGGNYWKISTQTIGFAAGEAMMGEIVLYNPSGTTSFKSATWKTLLHDEEGDALTCSGGGAYKDGVAATTGIHFFFHIGNIASGVFKLWGSNE